RPVAFGDPAAPNHLITNGDARRVAVVRIFTLVENAIDRYAAGRAGTRHRVRQVHLEHFARLQEPRTAEVQHRGDAFVRTRRIKVRIETVGWVAVRTTNRAAAGTASAADPVCLEDLAGPSPTFMHAGIKVADFLRNG